ncbi:MAG: peroxidase-related enzyme [Gammaproteobacteria bacterium]|nr:peroxidase-related enzyme [Gammaproteobacteria bacterium]
MTWIATVAFEDATGKVRQLYERIKGPDNNVDNIMMAHSLRPHTMEGHMAIYKNVIHHPRNTLPKWLLEAVGVYVSLINKCDYCIEHHYAGMRRLLNDDERSSEIRTALEAEDPEQAFGGRELAALRYAAALTRTPTDISPEDLDALREASLDDGEILEVNQVAAYFNYANRTVLGLGINKDGDIIGLSPTDGEDMDNWSHQ